ncbi:MAG: ABC transporter ATP-binding protein [Holophaga sp.]|nr:ABC transporter ATP-binding protein [Holophaga sp.]
MNILEGIRLNHHFGGVQAVVDLDLAVPEGQTLAVIGPNGAGKTTLFNLLAGTLPAQEGRVILHGKDISRLGPERRAGLGLIRSFQHGRTFANLSAEDNLLLGAHTRRMAGRSGPFGTLVELAQALVPFGPFRREEARLRAEARSLAEPFGERLAPYLDRPAYSFSYANRRRIEIARALAAHPRVLLLDEPTAGMNPAETLEMIAFLRTLKDAGLTMVIIEHKLPLIMQLSDSVIVMDDGRKIAEDQPQRIPLNPQVISAYLGPNHGSGGGEESHASEPADPERH